MKAMAIAYALYVAANLASWFFQAKKHNWKTFTLGADHPLLITFILGVIQAVFVTAFVATFGLIPATTVMIWLYVVTFVVGALESLILGDLRFTVIETLISVPIYMFIVVGLFQAAWA